MTILQKILTTEGITKADIAKCKGLNTTTIHYLCKDPDYYKKRKEVTKHKILLAINKLGGSKKTYDLNEIFPE